VKTEVAVCITHYKNILNCLPSLLKELFKKLLFLIHNCFFIQFYTVFNNVYGVCETGMTSLYGVDIWIIVWFSFFVSSR